MQINKFKAIIKEIFNETRKQFPETKDETLYGNGAIYYQNGNDGTEFDWKANNCLCEFMVFHKASEMGFIKAIVKRNGNVNVYVYDDGEYSPKHETKLKNVFTKQDTEWFAGLMLCIADNKDLFDIDIEKLGWNTSPDQVKHIIKSKLK